MATERQMIDVAEARGYVETFMADPILKLAANAVLNNTPRVDAVEVVRCKECMCCRGVESTENRALECSNPLGLPIITPDTYCAYGERRTNDR